MKSILYVICVIALLSTTGCISREVGEIGEAELILKIVTIRITATMVETIVTMADTTTTIINPKRQPARRNPDAALNLKNATN